MKKRLPIKETLLKISEVFHFPFYDYKKIDSDNFLMYANEKSSFMIYSNRNILEKGDELKIVYYPIETVRREREYVRFVQYKNNSGVEMFAKLNTVNKLRWQFSEPLLKYYISLGQNYFGYSLTIDSIYKLYNKFNKWKESTKYNKQTGSMLKLNF